MPLFLVLALQDVAGLGAADLEVRAEAEARLKALDPAHAAELDRLRASSGDVEVRARLGLVVKRLREKEVERLFAAADLPGALKALGGEEVERRTRRAEDQLKALLRERSAEFSMDGDVLRPASWEQLAPQLEPLLPWAYPALIRGLVPGTRGHGDAVFILQRLGERARPALLWAERHGSPAARAQASALLRQAAVAVR
jgi:hypothetical protein